MAKISTCWQPKTPQIATVEKSEKQQEEEDSEPINPATDEEVSPEVLHQLQNQATNIVLQPVEAGIMVDNFGSDIAKEPSGSSWDTTPAASAIKFFEGMADEDRRQISTMEMKMRKRRYQSTRSQSRNQTRLR